MSDKASAILAVPTRKTSPMHVPEWGEEGTDILVRELGTDARVAFLGAVKVDTVGGTGSLNLGVLVPYVTDLIADPDTGKPLFEAANHDALVEGHPGVVGRVLLEAVNISDMGASGGKAAESFSEPTPN